MIVFKQNDPEWAIYCRFHHVKKRKGVMKRDNLWDYDYGFFRKDGPRTPQYKPTTKKDKEEHELEKITIYELNQFVAATPNSIKPDII